MIMRKKEQRDIAHKEDERLAEYYQQQAYIESTHNPVKRIVRRTLYLASGVIGSEGEGGASVEIKGKEKEGEASIEGEARHHLHKEERECTSSEEDDTWEKIDGDKEGGNGKNKSSAATTEHVYSDHDNEMDDEEKRAVAKKRAAEEALARRLSMPPAPLRLPPTQQSTAAPTQPQPSLPKGDEQQQSASPATSSTDTAADGYILM